MHRRVRCRLVESETSATTYLCRRCVQYVVQGFYLNAKILFQANWHVADRSCRKLGAELMVLDNQEDKLLTTTFLKSMGLSFTQSWHHSVWAGINCLGNRRTFLLAQNGETVPYLNWVPLEPNNASPEEDCVGFANYNGAFGYHDIECKVQFPYVCQREPAEDYLCLKRDLFLKVLL